MEINFELDHMKEGGFGMTLILFIGEFIIGNRSL